MSRTTSAAGELPAAALTIGSALPLRRLVAVAAWLAAGWAYMQPSMAPAAPAESILYAFKAKDHNDGDTPFADLIFDEGGALYGTTPKPWGGFPERDMQIGTERLQRVAPPVQLRRAGYAPIAFSACGLSDGDRLGAWQKAFVETFVPCRIERNSDEPFWSEFTALTVGPVIVGSIAGPAKICTRDRWAVDQDRIDYLHLHLMWRGEKVSRQGGREIAVSAGEALVYHNRQPSTTVAPVATQVRTIKVPDSAVHGRLGETARFAGAKLPSHVPELRILTNYVKSLDFAGDLAEAPVREMVGGHLVDLIVAALSRTMAGTIRHARTASRLPVSRRSSVLSRRPSESPHSIPNTRREDLGCQSDTSRSFSREPVSHSPTTWPRGVSAMRARSCSTGGSAA